MIKAREAVNESRKVLMSLLILGFCSLVCCRSDEHQAFYEAYNKVTVGMTKTEVLNLLGTPQETGTEFHLSQPAGYESRYREAATSRSVRYSFWFREIDMTYAVGFDKADRVAYKASGGT